jgi:hypothetical protein
MLICEKEPDPCLKTTEKHGEGQGSLACLNLLSDMLCTRLSNFLCLRACLRLDFLSPSDMLIFENDTDPRLKTETCF